MARGASPALALVALLAGAAGASAQAPLRVLAATDGSFQSFGEPAAASTGWVVFHATRKDARDGIWASAGGAPAAVAVVGAVVPDGPRSYTIARLGTRPTVNDRLAVAFTAEFREGARAVLVSRGFAAKFRVVADSGEAFRSFGDEAVIDGSGDVLFHAVLDPPGHPDRTGFDAKKVKDPRILEDPDQFVPMPERVTVTGRRRAFHEGLYLDRVRRLVDVGDTERDFLDVQDGCALNDAGVVAFVASRRPRNWTVFLDQGGRPLELAQTGASFTSLRRPAINRRGRVAFVAETADGGAAVCRAFDGTGQPTVLADGKSGFSAIGAEVSIDDRGAVAFVGRRDDGTLGIFLVDTPGQARLIVAAGAALATSTVTGFRLSNRAFARPGQITALVALEPPGEAIVVVDLAL